MKLLSHLLKLVLIAFLFSSCYDAVQKIDFAENGGGKVIYSIDFSKGITMMKVFIPDSIQQSPDFKKSIDTSVTMFEVMPDSVKRIKDEQSLKMYKNTVMNAQMDMASNKLKIIFTSDASTEKDMTFRLKNFEKELSESGSFMGGSGSQNMTGGMSPIDVNYFIYDYKKGYFKRSVDTAAFSKNLKQNASMYDMIKDAGLDATFTLDLNFPKAVKKCKSSKVVLSKDKKNATLKYSLKEAIKDPSIMEIEIEY